MSVTLRSRCALRLDHRPSSRRSVSVMTAAVVLIVAACVALALATTESLSATPDQPRTGAHASLPPRDSQSLSSTCRYPAGRTEPSGVAPPRANLLAGFTLSYCTDFLGHDIPPGWFKFSGVPSGDPSGLFVRSHVAVGHGRLFLRVFRVPHHGNGWGTGGICHCGLPRLYGAFFVRSRVTGRGPDEINLLWPVAHMWPPEIDFNESVAQTGSSTWSVHFGRTNTVVHGATRMNLMHWHTWGVVWTPRAIRFLVDGHQWGAVTNRSQVPHQPMTLDIQNQTSCGRGKDCPSRPVTMQVDWVAEFALVRPLA